MFSFMLIAVLLLLIFSLGISIYSGAPFLPTHTWVVDKIVKMAKEKHATLVADIGAGNGKIIIALAKEGIEAHGYEINPWLVLWGKHLIRKNGVGGKAFMHLSNFWHQDFARFDTVIVFGIDKIMGKLEKKLQAELKPNSLVICNVFPFPEWPGVKDEPLYLYKR
jgi:ribosomal protein L11 methylase PrmA